MAGRERSQTPMSISATSSSSEEESFQTFQHFFHADEERHDNPEDRSTYRLPKIDPSVLSDLEEQSKVAAGSLAQMTKYLITKLAEMSKVTVETSHVYAEAVQKASCSAEENIKLMYALMAKCQELNQNMKPVYEIQHQVDGIKHQLDILESAFK